MLRQITPSARVHRPLGGPPSLFCSPYSLGVGVSDPYPGSLWEQTPRPGDRKGREMAMDFTVVCPCSWGVGGTVHRGEVLLPGLFPGGRVGDSTCSLSLSFSPFSGGAAGLACLWGGRSGASISVI